MKKKKKKEKKREGKIKRVNEAVVTSVENMEHISSSSIYFSSLPFLDISILQLLMAQSEEQEQDTTPDKSSESEQGKNACRGRPGWQRLDTGYIPGDFSYKKMY